jgi:cytochrome P450
MPDVERTDEFDPDRPEALSDPDIVYGPLRQRCPVAWSAKYGGFWAATRYADIEAITTDPATFTTTHGIIVPKNPASGRRPPLHFDPPEHTIYRKAMNPAFRKDRLARLGPVIRRFAAEMLEAMAAAHSASVVDFYRGFCSPFASRVVCALCNVADHDANQLSVDMEEFESAQRARDPVAIERYNQLLYEICRGVVAERVRAPLDPDEDLVSGLLALRMDGDRVDPEVVAGSLRQIVVAGHGAPALVMASAVAHLAADPGLQNEWRARPLLVTAGIEEMLRLHTPNIGFARTATRCVELGGRSIREGDMVALVLPSANRDEVVFDRPAEVLLGRPGRHLAFGHGVHVCPGSVTGRDELAVALRALLGATEHFEIAGEIVYSPWPTAGPTTLPLRIHWRPPVAKGGREGGDNAERS